MPRTCCMEEQVTPIERLAAEFRRRQLAEPDESGAYWLDAARIVACIIGPVYRADIRRCHTKADFKRPPQGYIVAGRYVPLRDLLKMAQVAQQLFLGSRAPGKVMATGM